MWLPHVVDLRRGEGPTLARAAATLFLILAAHTALETARDALLLTRFPARDLGAIYVVMALGVLPIAAWVARASIRIGARKTLVVGLVAVAFALAVLFAIPTSTASVLVLYLMSCVLGAVVVPLHFGLLGSVFTVAEGKRLFGAVTAAGTLGATVGSGSAAALVGVIPVKALLLVAAAAALAAILTIPSAPPEPPTRIDGELPRRERIRVASEPFLLRIALLVAASAAAYVLVDFTFKWTIARAVSPERIATFVARFYALASAAALVAQIALSRAVVERLGVAWAILVVPLVIVVASATTLAFGGAVIAVLLLKGIDGTLRYSVHRVTIELIYLPLDASKRARAKPLIDGALVRVVQAGAGAGLFALGVGGRLSPQVLLAVAIGLGFAWLVVAWTMRTPYVALLRRTISAGNLEGAGGASDPLDLETIEALIGHLSSEDPNLVLGALHALARRNRSRLVPALVLLHEDESVLTRALSIFATSDRKDWLGRARKLLRDQREGVRMAAARALASRGALVTEDVAKDESSRMRGYATLYLALERTSDDLTRDPGLAEVLARAGSEGEDARIGVISAIADAPPNARLASLLERFASHECTRPFSHAEVARAVRAQHVVSMAPALIAQLVAREGREGVRAALLSFGDTAVDALRRALADPSSRRSLRVHIPNTLARFGTRRAAEALLDVIESDRDGLVRYKSVRALGRLVAASRIKLVRERVERLALRNLVEHFRLLGLRAPLDASPLTVPSGLVPREPTERLLVGMLNDKLRQSLERTFRLLKIAHPFEDFHRVHIAYVSGDKRARANAAELLGTLLRKPDQAHLRGLLRALAEEQSVLELVEHSRRLVDEPPPRTRAEALDRLVRDQDATLAALAELHVAAARGQTSRVVIGSRDRAPIELSLTTKEAVHV